MIDENIFKKLSIFVAISFLLILALFVLWPIAPSIMFGLVLSYTFYPAYKKIFSYVKEKNISALIVILLVTFLIFIPLWFLLPLIVKQIFDIYLYLQKINTLNFLNAVFPKLSDSLSKDFALTINNLITSTASNLFSKLSSLILDVPNLLLKIVVTIFVFFFGMRDAELFSKYALSLSPFSKKTEKEFAKKFKDITKAVIYGQAMIGIVQGLLAGLGLFVSRVPNSLILTVIAIFTSIIPIIGAWVVWLPASIYLIVTGKFVFGIILFVYGALIVSWADNFLRTYLIARKTKISTAIILVGMIGGLIVFGILGLIIGPLILAYLLLILEAYRNKKFPQLFSK